VITVDLVPHIDDPSDGGDIPLVDDTGDNQIGIHPIGQPDRIPKEAFRILRKSDGDHNFLQIGHDVHPFPIAAALP
jgi:hypothetical protein